MSIAHWNCYHQDRFGCRTRARSVGKPVGKDDLVSISISQGNGQEGKVLADVVAFPTKDQGDGLEKRCFNNTSVFVIRSILEHSEEGEWEH